MEHCKCGKPGDVETIDGPLCAECLKKSFIEWCARWKPTRTDKPSHRKAK